MWRTGYNRLNSSHQCIGISIMEEVEAIDALIGTGFS